MYSSTRSDHEFIWYVHFIAVTVKKLARQGYLLLDDRLRAVSIKVNSGLEKYSVNMYILTRCK